MIMPGVQYPHWSPWCSQNASCSGCSAPSWPIPSIVLTSAPSACTASRVQDFTASPLRCTVHAPQLDVSQPTCVPVRPSVSRRKWTRSRRGSTSALSCAPFTVIVTCTEPAMRLLPVEKPGGPYRSGDSLPKGGSVAGGAPVVGEGELREQQPVLGPDVDEGEGQVGARHADLLGRGADLALGLDEADDDVVQRRLPVGALPGHAQAAGADVTRERGPRLVLVAGRTQMGRQDDRGAGEVAALAEAEGVEQRGDQLAVGVAGADAGLQGVQAAAGLDQ